jgi:hypothetical protein
MVQKLVTLQDFLSVERTQADNIYFYFVINLLTLFAVVFSLHI